MMDGHEQERPRHEARLSAALYLVPTPLGNLGDITLRALDVLRRADHVAAEDTRQARRLLAHFGIQARLLSLHEHNEAAAAHRIVELLSAGQSVALVSDAGTPCISDPGARLVAALRAAGHAIVPLPGPNAAVTAVSAAGLDDAHFLFYGFLPVRQAARRKVLEELRPLPFALVFYEAPHRIVESVADLADLLEPERSLVIGRELTKLFETLACMPLPDAPQWLAEDHHRRRGEFVLVVSAPPAATGLTPDAERVLRILLAELPLKQAVRLAAEISGGARNLLYDLALTLRVK